MLQNTTNKTLFSIATLFLILSGYKAFAGTGTESLQFLNIKPSARATSLGDSFVSMANDASATFYNPAGLVQLDNMEISLMHMVYLAETGYEFGSITVPLGDKLRVGGYIVYLNYGSISRTTEDSGGSYLGSTESFAPYDLAGAVSVGYKIGNNISIGMNIKVAVSDIDGNSLSRFLGDAGVLMKLTEEINIGAVVYNLGVSSPISGKAGVSTKVALVEKDDLTVGIGANYIRENGALSVSLGAEYNDKSNFSIRAGYGTAEADGINIGAGIKQELGDITGSLDYNFSMLGDMGSTHRISVGAKFGVENRGKNRSRGGSTREKTNTGSKRFLK
jgi:long-subunit fatty acid transport protein